MTPEEIYRTLAEATALLAKVHRRSLFTATEQDLLFICLDSMRDTLAGVRKRYPNLTTPPPRRADSDD